MEKYWFTYEEIHRTIRDLADKIGRSGFDADAIVAIGSGGYIPARILRTYIKKPIWAVGIAYYDDKNKPTDTPHKVQWVDEVERKLTGKRILLVDEVDDSRTTLEYCVRELMNHKPEEIAVAVLHNKLKEKRGTIPPEVKLYLAGKELEDRWVCYPWDALDIDEQNRQAGGTGIRA